jgi:hypothetical protein
MKSYGYPSSSSSVTVATGCALIFAMLAVVSALFYGEVCWANYELVTIWSKHIEMWKLVISMILLTLLGGASFPILVIGQLYIWFFM